MRTTPLLLILISCGSLLLTNCSSLKTPAPRNLMLSSASREAQLSGIKDWRLQGAIGIITPNEGVSGSLTWVQKGDAYTINVFGPLGTYGFKVIGSKDQIEFIRHDGKHFLSKSPESLLRAETGWQLPISNLYYWVRGIANPNLAKTQTKDALNHLVTLNQAGWQIQYVRYLSVSGVDLPNKIFLVYPQLKIKLVMSRWEI